MKRRMLALIGGLLLCLGTMAQSASGASPPESLNEQLLSEQKHFFECLACVYSPAWWMSYNDSLYFQPRNEAQVKQLEAMKAARSRYLALTNQETRHDLTAKLMAESGISRALATEAPPAALGHQSKPDANIGYTRARNS